jgi:lysophospholipase L1-like esterase
MKSLLCFGDSNTWGSMPMAFDGDTRRMLLQERWPGVVQQRLGRDSWHVVEEGLPGRTIARDDLVVGEYRNALRALRAVLESHRPLQRVIFMLGTNDLKAQYAASAQQIADGLHALIDITQASALPNMPAPAILVVCPPPIAERGCLAEKFSGGAAKAVAMASLFSAVAAQRAVDFFDAGSVASVSASDGIHMDTMAHQALGNALADWLRESP